MSDDFGTVNVKRGDRSREIEVMRQQYRNHREALTRMAADAPTEHLAGEYHRLIRDVDAAVRKLDELDGKVIQEEAQRNTEPGTRPAFIPPPSAASLRAGTDAGNRPLAPSPAAEELADTTAGPNPMGRILAIVAAGLVVLAVIGWMIYRASNDRRKPDTITEGPAVTTQVTPATAAPEPVSAPPEAAATGLTVSPASADYGTIRKGTRAVRQFEVVNATTAPVAIKVSRSTCKCLFYDYRENVPAKGKETVTVTIDGARAKAGTMNETVHVTSKKDPAVETSFSIAAVIK
jgi:hypothetical protein